VKGFFIFIAVLIALMIWANESVTREDIIKYAKDQKSEDWTPKIEYYLGVYDYTRSDWTKAAPTFETLLADYPTGYYSANSVFKLGDCYYHMARRNDAVAQYQHYLEVWPDGELKDLAAKNVEMLRNQ
jgi:TolA-binding protein